MIKNNGIGPTSSTLNTPEKICVFNIAEIPGVTSLVLMPNVADISSILGKKLQANIESQGMNLKQYVISPIEGLIEDVPQLLDVLNQTQLMNVARMLVISVGLVSFSIGMQSCDSSNNPGPGDVVNEIKFKEYSVEPKPGEIYFTLPDGKKVIADGLVGFDVKENLTTGTRTVKLVFDGTKLKQTLTNSFNEMKKSYPNGRYGLNLRFSKININGIESKLTSALEFVEKYDKQIGAVGLDQLQNNVKYSFEEMVGMSGGSIVNEAGTNNLQKGDKLIGNIGGGIESSTFNGYTTPVKIIFEI